jgi:hypothetical protein
MCVSLWCVLFKGLQVKGTMQPQTHTKPQTTHLHHRRRKKHAPVLTGLDQAVGWHDHFDLDGRPARHRRWHERAVRARCGGHVRAVHAGCRQQQLAHEEGLFIGGLRR